MNDIELKDYLSQILGTTFILDDGTRVKSVYLHWIDLTINQRQIALRIIKQAVVTEIKLLGKNENLLFEFNEITEELNQLFTELVGSDNEEVKWIEVDMS